MPPGRLVVLDDAGREKQAERIGFGVGFEVANPCVVIMGGMDGREIIAEPVPVDLHIIAAVGPARYFRKPQGRRGAAVFIAAATFKRAAIFVFAAPVSGRRRAGCRKDRQDKRCNEDKCAHIISPRGPRLQRRFIIQLFRRRNMSDRRVDRTPMTTRRFLNAQGRTMSASAIWPSNGCGGETPPMTVKIGYCGSRLEGHLVNIGPMFTERL